MWSDTLVSFFYIQAITLYPLLLIWLRRTKSHLEKRKHMCVLKEGLLDFWSGRWMRNWQRGTLSGRLRVGCFGVNQKAILGHLLENVGEVVINQTPKDYSVPIRMVTSLPLNGLCWTCWTEVKNTVHTKEFVRMKALYTIFAELLANLKSISSIWGE